MFFVEELVVVDALEKIILRKCLQLTDVVNDTHIINYIGHIVEWEIDAQIKIMNITKIIDDVELNVDGKILKSLNMIWRVH